MDQTRTEVGVNEPEPAPEVSDPPLALSIVIWIGVFSGIAWGLMALFRDRSPPPSDGLG